MHTHIERERERWGSGSDRDSDTRIEREGPFNPSLISPAAMRRRLGRCMRCIWPLKAPYLVKLVQIASSARDGKEIDREGERERERERQGECASER